MILPHRVYTKDRGAPCPDYDGTIKVVTELEARITQLQEQMKKLERNIELKGMVRS